MKNCLKYFSFFLCFILLLHISCKKEQKKTEETNSKEVSASNKQPEFKPENLITITGKTDEPSTFKYLNLLDFKGLFGDGEHIESKKIIGDSLILTLKGFTQPQLLDVIAFRDSSDIPFYTRIFMSPGDSISMKVKNGKIRFSGKNEAHYNFFLDMNDPLRQNWAVYQGNFNKYKKETAAAYQKKQAFFTNYIKAHPEVSQEFKTKVGDELKFEYLFNLIAPRDHKGILGYYRNNWQGITNVVTTNYEPNKENLFDAKAYFDTINIEDFKRPDLLTNDYFKRSLIFYLRHYFASQEYLEYSRENFLTEKEYIEEHLDGKLKTFAIARLITDYHKKGFGIGKGDIGILKNLIQQYDSQFSKDPTYVAKMNEVLGDLDSYNFKLPEIVLESKLLTLQGDTVTFARTLRKARNKIKLVNFWASWCAPCIQEFKKAKSYKRKLKTEDGVNAIHISVDEKEEDWLKRISQLEEYLSKDDHYLVLDMENSPLLKTLLFRERNGERSFFIPKYTLIDKKDMIISNNAPRPSDTLMFQKLIDQVNLNR